MGDGGFMEPLLEIAIEKTRAKTERKTKLNSIRSLMETMNFSAQQAMDGLKIPADKQEEYRKLIQTVRKIDDKKIRVKVKCNEQAMTYWALQYGKDIVIESPQSLIDSVKKIAKKILADYE